LKVKEEDGSKQAVRREQRDHRESRIVLKAYFLHFMKCPWACQRY
jgi:hypothetical protein